MKNNKDSAQHTPKELMHELQSLVSEAQSMMGDSVTEHSHDAVNRLRERFGAVQDRFSEIYQDTRKKVVAGAKYTDHAIRENPYQAVAVALGVGVLVGVVIGRRSSR